MKGYVNGIGMMAPGLSSWASAREVLKDDTSYKIGTLGELTTDLLQANERRRTTKLIKLALNVAQQAAGENFDKTCEYHAVFSASDGDHEVIDRICMALALPEHPVSPTNFHNSVHNAAAGYWAIAANAVLGSISISACDESFSAGLLEAMAIVEVKKNTVLLVSYDYPPCQPLSKLRDVKNAFAVAMIISPEETPDSVAVLEIELADSNAYTRSRNPELEALRADNPAARSIPLLILLARNIAGDISLPAVQNRSLDVSVRPCQ
jgi:hypothetical protein